LILFRIPCLEQKPEFRTVKRKWMTGFFSLLHDFKTLRILHGTGDGILRKAVASILKKYSFVKNFRSELPEYGGDGVTVVELE